MGWIKCSDRLPEPGQQALAASFKFKLYETAIFFYGNVADKPIFGASNGSFIATH